jgi:hypothetical protein
LKGSTTDEGDKGKTVTLKLVREQLRIVASLDGRNMFERPE